MTPRALIPLLFATLAAVTPAAAQQAAPSPKIPAQAPATQATPQNTPASANPAVPTLSTPPPAPPPPPPTVPGAVELDHVVAIVGTNVILQSDVLQEMRFSALEPLRVLPGQNTPDRALRRLIDRTLILQQMKEQQEAITTPGPDVTRALDELRKQIPACARYRCESGQGWADFLKAQNLTPGEVEQRWSQRMAILGFIDLRFRSGIRISQEQIAAYYNTVLVPALAKRHDSAPPLASVSTRIREILLQQQVSGMLQDWLSSLREQGNVRIVDPIYAAGLDAALESPGASTGPGEPVDSGDPNE